MIGVAVGALALASWAYLLAFNGGFWLARETDAAPVSAPSHWPPVVAVVPARDEAEVIARAVGSLAAQDYPGDFRLLLVDDGSSDGTAVVARDAVGGFERLTILPGVPLPRGWTGKLWAMAQGVEAAGAPEFLWFTDADIAHAPDTLRSLVARGEAEGLALNSLMAELACDTAAERALVPAFVLFFQMLYPFARLNDPKRAHAGAAGGCMLVRRAALERAGGLATIADALIDDCALGAALKRQGAIRLSLTHRSVSIRSYGCARDIGAMISRSAYAQLRYDPWLLAGTLVGLALVFLVGPLLAIFTHGLARAEGIAAWGLMAIAYQPMLRFYRRSLLWGLALPAIAAFYGGATFASGLQHARGRGGMWKGRAQAELSR
jgi:hopene-associated glycosyltransferase HpnB